LTIQAIAELAWRQIFPNPKDETSVTKEEFIETAKLEYASQVWRFNREEKLLSGENNINPVLLSDKTLPVKEKRIDISSLGALRSLPNNTWIQSLGEIGCGECQYDIMDLNKYRLLCDDDSRNPEKKPAIVQGKSIFFPEGAHTAEVPIVYANTGSDLDDETEVDDAIGGVVRRALIDIYGKRMPEDKTNNSNSNV
jgi:hypothetical protein